MQWVFVLWEIQADPKQIYFTAVLLFQNCLAKKFPDFFKESTNTNTPLLSSCSASIPDHCQVGRYNYVGEKDSRTVYNFKLVFPYLARSGLPGTFPVAMIWANALYTNSMRHILYQAVRGPGFKFQLLGYLAAGRLGPGGSGEGGGGGGGESRAENVANSGGE